ncbi:hypothetical protein A359_00710 [secondary endosymbiont of Ctenarytaina eucalypti]|uniref:Uncharacterized protein n=1 Tax=secondary endosymbiont of Ctenarytaina eucalypti TaxID=1199245 RepID=J3VRA6_9ENTR|nr:hypothetical protein A359_00710 [secondary endosymbiont of Ctenarytaina eucalypti]
MLAVPFLNSNNQIGMGHTVPLEDRYDGNIADHRFSNLMKYIIKSLFFRTATAFTYPDNGFRLYIIFKKTAECQCSLSPSLDR